MTWYSFVTAKISCPHRQAAVLEGWVQNYDRVCPPFFLCRDDQSVWHCVLGLVEQSPKTNCMSSHHVNESLFRSRVLAVTGGLKSLGHVRRGSKRKEWAGNEALPRDMFMYIARWLPLYIWHSFVKTNGGLRFMRSLTSQWPVSCFLVKVSSVSTFMLHNFVGRGEC